MNILAHTIHFKGAAPATPTYVAPASQSSAVVNQAKSQARIDAAKRKGINATMFAGETGGAPAANVINRTLLG